LSSRAKVKKRDTERRRWFQFAGDLPHCRSKALQSIRARSEIVAVILTFRPVRSPGAVVRPSVDPTNEYFLIVLS
jgi:hypothetical protein